MSIKTKTIENVVKILRALNAQYKIITEDGTEYGELVVANQKPKRRPRQYPLGHFSNYVKPYLQKLNVGDVAEVPLGEFDSKMLASRVSCVGIQMWGKGNCTVHMTPTHVEILRLG